MSTPGSKWKLRHLTQRSDLNGREVTIVEALDKSSGRVRVRFDDNATEPVRVKLCNLVSRVEEGVDAGLLTSALESLKANADDDINMRSFASRYEQGDFDGALSAASAWSLKNAKESL